MRRLFDIPIDVTVEQILDGFIPPPHFVAASFGNYIPDPSEPSQGAARAALEAFERRINSGPPRRSKGLFKRDQALESRPGVYLDGGFGVGKTHLLTALWHATDSTKKSFGTFVEYTNIIGLLGFRQAVRTFSDNTLICIDEFELDDPGDTVLMSTFCGELVQAGVYLAATSNTLPDKLGDERFAADDFVREIQGLAAHFDTIRIEGQDYRRRELTFDSDSFSDSTVVMMINEYGVAESVVVEWSELLSKLPTLHPAKYGALVESISLLGIVSVKPLRDQVQALRFVTLVDRLYDRSVPIIHSGVRLDQVFSTEMLKGGYRKKYFRCLSRLAVLAESGSRVVGSIRGD